jgi:MFS family permease
MTALLLNIAHAIDHLLLLIFATAVAAIAADFGMTRWEDLMPYASGAFLMFGLGSWPAGRLGDLWSRRAMMLVFFFGIGISSLLVALAQGPWQLAAALTLVGLFSAIYHPVGIPMLLQSTKTPGKTIGINGLSGNLGIAAAALITGALVQWAGWRAAFIVPGLLTIACGIAFAWLSPPETEAPARRKPSMAPLEPRLRSRILLVMTLTAITGGLAFNLTTNGNGELLKARMPDLLEQPAMLGVLLAVIYTLASLAQVVVGRLIDRYPIRTLMVSIIALQPLAFLLAANAQGWAMFAAMIVFMVLVFGAIPFTEAIIARFVDDSMRSRVSGVRITISFGVSSAAVWALGPVVKATGFTTLMIAMAVITATSAALACLLPREDHLRT